MCSTRYLVLLIVINMIIVSNMMLLVDNAVAKAET
jgi:hypothetical protein